MSTRARHGTRSPAGAAGGLRAHLTGSGLIAAAMIVMNLGTYGYTMSVARIIGPAAYGAFFALMNLLLIVSVVQLGLQATAARRISADPGHVAQIEREILRVSWRAALVVGALLLAGAPLIDALLDLQSLPTAALAAFASIPMTMMGAQAGILQGERRWRELAILYVLSGVPRLIVGLALVLSRPTELMAFLGVGIGFWVPYLYGTVVLRHSRAEGESDARHGFLPVIKETVVSSQALFAFFALTNADMLIARSLLDSHDSGLYAAGLIVSRAVMFLPQFVVVIAFPSMSSEVTRGRVLALSLGVVAGIGAVSVAATALLPGLALTLAGGSDYAEVRGHLWLFALLGTTMAVLQLLVYSVIARQAAVSIVLVWLALASLAVVAVTLVSSVTGMLTTVLVVELVLLVVLVGLSLHAHRKVAVRAA